MAEFRILSLDGGGSWALIQVRVLIDLFSARGDGSDVTGHDVLKKFDLVVANSGGAMALGGLIKNWPLIEILDMFMNQQKRDQIFVPDSFFDDPFAHLTGLAGIGPKYSAKAKLQGLRALLGADGDRLVSEVPNAIGAGYGGRPVHVVLCAFDYDINREAFFRSDGASLAANRAPHFAISVAQAIHASSNAPVNYFDAPARGPLLTRFWDGAIGGYNNPLLLGVIEALANAAPYNTDRASIKALSIGTANVALPLSKGTTGEDADLVAHRDDSTILADLKKLATSVIDDPPDAATFHAHLMLGSPLPKPGDAVPVNDRIVRMNPLIQPVPGGRPNLPWDFPPGMNRNSFVALRDLDMDAVKQPDVLRVNAFCDLWFADKIPNQPIRANSADLSAEIGFGRYGAAKAAAKALKLAP